MGFALQLIPTPIAPAPWALAAVHSNKKTVVYYELPRSTTSDARNSLDIWQRFQMPTTRAAARTAAEWDRNRRREIITGEFRSA